LLLQHLFISVLTEERILFFGYLEYIVMVKSRRMREQGMWRVWGREKVHTGFWWENLREIDHLEDVSLFWRIILK
jgi:hypothetical protein